MSVAVLARDLDQRRLPVLVISASLLVLTLGALGAGSGLQDSIDDLTAAMPEALIAFIPADVPGGYVVGEVFNLIAPLALVGYAALAGAAAVAGEEDRGTMAVLISHPVTRRRVLAAKTAGLFIALTAIAGVFGASSLLASTVFGTGLSTSGVAAACVHLLALAVTFGALGLAIGGLTGDPSRAAVVAGGAGAVAYVSSSLLPLAGFDTLARISPWHYYASSNPLVNGVDLSHVLVLLALAAASTLVASVGFEHRDLKG